MATFIYFNCQFSASTQGVHNFYILLTLLQLPFSTTNRGVTVQELYFFFHWQFWVINSRSETTWTGLSNDHKVFLNPFLLGVDIASYNMLVSFLLIILDIVYNLFYYPFFLISSLLILFLNVEISFANCLFWIGLFDEGSSIHYHIVALVWKRCYGI